MHHPGDNASNPPPNRISSDKIRRVVAARLASGMGSQAVSMAVNVVTVVGVARLLESSDFGRFALIYGLVQLSVGVTRSLTSDVLAASFGSEPAAINNVQRATIKTMTASVAILLPVLLGASFAVAGGLSAIGILTAISVIPLSLHEHSRQFAFVLGQPKLALGIDLIWGAATFIFLILAWALPLELTAVWLILGWSAGAVCGSLVGLKLFGLGKPHISGTKVWSEKIRRDGPAFVFEFGISRGIPEAVAWTLAITGSVADAGSFRLAQTLLGPVSVVIGGLRSPMMAELRRVALKSGNHLKVASRAGLALGTVPAAYVVVAFLIPSETGTQIVGQPWRPALVIMSFLAIRRALGASALPAFLLLRIWRFGNLTSRLRLIDGVLALLGSLVGAAIMGPNGALSGLVLAAFIGTIIWWRNVNKHVLPIQLEPFQRMYSPGQEIDAEMESSVGQSS